jgi:hypothetical protein
MNRPWIRLALGAALACTPCLAQRSALEPPDLGRYLRWGPLRARPGFQVSNLGYDDNIFSSNVDPVGDYTATWAPRLDGLLLLGDRAFLEFEGKLEYTTYLEYRSQNFLNERGQARLTLPYRRMGVYVDGLLNRIQERPLDAEDIRVDRAEDGYGAGVILAPGWRTEIEIGGARERLRYSDPDADPDQTVTVGDRLDRTENLRTLEVRYGVFGRTRLTLDAHTSRIDFRSPVSANRQSRGWGIVPGIDFGEGGPLAGAFRVGRMRIDAEDPVQPDFDDIVARAEVRYRLGPRTTLRLDGEREPDYTLSSTGVFYIATRARLRAVRYLNRIVGVEAGASRGTLEFPVSAGVFEREDRLQTYEVGLRFRLAQNSLGRRIEYSLRLERYRRDSNDDAFDRSRTRWGVNAIVGF